MRWFWDKSPKIIGVRAGPGRMTRLDGNIDNVLLRAMIVIVLSSIVKVVLFGDITIMFVVHDRWCNFTRVLGNRDIPLTFVKDLHPIEVSIDTPI